MTGTTFGLSICVSTYIMNPMTLTGTNEGHRVRAIGVRSFMGLKVGVVMAGALILRVIYLDADPSALISRDFITDEGWWAHNARNAFLYGHWRIDDHNLGTYSAYLFSAMVREVFGLFGIGYGSLRLVPALSGWLTVVLVFLLVRREANRRAAIFAALLLGFSNLHILYSRTGFPESTMVFFLALMLWLWSLRREQRLFALAAGIAFSLMVMTKITAVYFVPGLILFALVQRTRDTISRSHALLFLCGTVSVATAYTVLFIIPNFHDWLSFNLRNGSGSEWPSGPAGVIAGILKLLGSSFFGTAPVITSLSLLAVAGLIVSASRNGFRAAICSAPDIDVTTIALIAGYMLSLSVTVYQPERRFVPVLFLMVILAARFVESGRVSIHELSIQELSGAGENPGAWAWFVLLFLLPIVGILEIWREFLVTGWILKVSIIAVLVWIAHRMGRGLWPHQFRRRLLIVSWGTFCILFAFLSIGRIYRALAVNGYGLGSLWNLEGQTVGAAMANEGKVLAVGGGLLIACSIFLYCIVRDRRRRWQWLMAAFLLVEFVQIATWLFAPTYTMKQANTILADKLTANDTVATHYETVMLSSGAVAICKSERRNLNLDAFQRFDPRYVLVLIRDNWRDYALEEASRDEWPPPGSRLPVKLETFDLCPVHMRGPRFSLELYHLQ